MPGSFPIVGAELRDEFMLQAKLMELDALTDPSSSEPLSERFWRRYGASAFELLERKNKIPFLDKIYVNK